MNEGNFDHYKEKNKEAGVAEGKLAEVVEPEAREDIALLFSVVAERSPEVKEPGVFVVKRIFTRTASNGQEVEVALITDRDHADVPQDVVQQYISKLPSRTTPRDYSRFSSILSPEQIALMSERTEPKQHPMREIMDGGRDEKGIFFYVVPTAFLRPKPSAEVVSIEELRRRRNES